LVVVTLETFEEEKDDVFKVDARHRQNLLWVEEANPVDSELGKLKCNLNFLIQ